VEFRPALLFKLLGSDTHPAKANVVIAMMMMTLATLANLIVDLLMRRAAEQS
jgi:hypothetical protein